MVVFRAAAFKEDWLILLSIHSTAMLLAESHSASPIRFICAFLFGFVLTIRIDLAYCIALLLHLLCHLDFMKNSSSYIPSHLSIRHWIRILTWWICILYFYIVLLVRGVSDNSCLLSHKSLREASLWTIIFDNSVAIRRVLIIKTIAIIILLHLEYLVSKGILYDSIEFWERLLHLPILLIV